MSAQLQPRHWLHLVTSSQPARSDARSWQGYLLWIVAAAFVGLGTAGIFSSLLELSRDWFVAVYAAIVVPFAFAFAGWSGIDIAELFRRNLRRGVIGAIVVGALMVAAVQGMDASPRPDGVELVWDLLWLGVVYGTVDALLLSVVPIVAVWRASAHLGHMTTWAGKVMTGAVAIVASIAVTTAYHLGYTEYRGSDVADPLVGNTIMSLGYLIFANPVTAIGAHIALHVASVIHGVDATVTLPPHY